MLHGSALGKHSLRNQGTKFRFANDNLNDRRESMAVLSEQSIVDSKQFRMLAIGMSVVVSVLIALDIAGDYQDGVPLTHLLSEVFVLSVSLMSIVYFGWMHYQLAQSRISVLKRELAIATHDAQQWRESNHELISRLTLQIQNQFDRWQLTREEAEVGMLMLKGFNGAEIAHLRQTSERVIRLHTQNIYRKSGISGRAELLAFFLGNL